MKGEGGLRNHLRSARTRLGLSQQELAQAAGVTRQTIGGIEAGLYAPSATVALRLARALRCRVEDLFWLDSDEEVLAATAAAELPAEREARVGLVKVGERWVAHPLHGEEAFRTEMVPADGLATAGPDGTVSVRLLDDRERLERGVLLAGCAPALSLWARAAERWHPGLRVASTFANSTRALHSLVHGRVHAAGLHLWDPTAGDFNTPFVRRMAGDQRVVLINLGVWEEGLLVKRGNPRGISGILRLAEGDVRLVNREAGAGSRMLLQQGLEAAGLVPSVVPGWNDERHSHLEVARAVAAGEADTGVSTAAVAAAYDLDFIPVRPVRYDLAVLEENLALPGIRQLLSTLEHRWVRTQLAVMGGYDTTRTGEVVAEVRNAA